METSKVYDVTKTKFHHLNVRELKISLLPLCSAFEFRTLGEFRAEHVIALMEDIPNTPHIWFNSAFT